MNNKLFWILFTFVSLAGLAVPVAPIVGVLNTPAPKMEGREEFCKKKATRPGEEAVLDGGVCYVIDGSRVLFAYRWHEGAWQRITPEG